MTYVFAIILAVSQILILPFSFRWIKEMSLVMGIIVSLSLLLWNKNKWISLFILWSLLLFLLTKSYLINDSGNNTFYIMNIVSMINFINIVLFGVMYFILRNLNLNKTVIYKTLCGIAVFQSVYIVLQMVQLDPFFFNFSVYTEHAHKKLSWPVGTWANESLVAWCIALCSPFFLNFRQLRYKIGYGLCFVAILCTKTSIGLFAFIAGFLFWLWHKNIKLTIVLLIALLLIGTILYSSGKLNYYLSDTHRYQVWKKTIDIWKPASITGLGHGSFRQTFYLKAPEFKSDGHWAQVHNEYLQVLYEQGLIGLGIILCLMWTTFYKFIQYRDGLIPITSLIICTVICIGGFPFRTAMAIIPLTCLVLFEKEYEA